LSALLPLTDVHSEAQLAAMTARVNIDDAKTEFSELTAAERQARAAKRAAAIGFAREKYKHLPPEAFDVPPAMIDEGSHELIARQ
jgi:hypothetical protein